MSETSHTPGNDAPSYGLYPLPQPLAGHQDAQEALTALKYLFKRFERVDKHKTANELRRQIAPAAILLALYLRQLGRPHMSTDDDDGKDKDQHIRHFVLRLDTVLETLRHAGSIVEMMRPYSFDVDHTSGARIKTTKIALPEVRAAIATNFCPLAENLQVPLARSDVAQKNEEAELAIVQWKAVQFFLGWCEENGRTGYDIVPLKQVNGHLLKLLSLKTDLEAIVAWKPLKY